MKNVKTFPFLLVFLLLGCVAEQPIFNTSTPPGENIPYEHRETITPTITAIDTPPMDLQVTTTSTPFEINNQDAETLIETNLIQACPQTVNDLIYRSDLSPGKLVLVHPVRHGSGGYLLNLASGTQVDLPTEGLTYLSNPAVSPDQHFLAYLLGSDDFRREILLVVNSEGDILYRADSHPSTASWVEGLTTSFEQGVLTSILIQWLDRQTILLGYGDRPFINAVSVFLNPFSGEWTTRTIDDQPIFYAFADEPFWGRYNLTRAVYHPSLNAVLIPTFRTDKSNDSIVLLDKNGQREILRLEDPLSRLPVVPYWSFPAQPVWSPDGNSFVIDLFSQLDPINYTSRNIYLGFLEGRIEQKTWFTNRYSGDFRYFSWSPDGKSVAFLLLDREEDKVEPVYYLAVLNIATGEVKNLCAPAYYEEIQGNILWPQFAPVWSPDSQYLAMAVRLSSDVDHIETIIIDTKDGSMQVIASDVYPVGWLE